MSQLLQGSLQNGKLETTKEQLEQHVKRQHSDPMRNVPLRTPRYVPRSTVPTAEFNTVPPKLSEVRQDVIWLDLANAYGSVPHQLIAMEFFHMPSCIKILEEGYFSELQMSFALQDFTSGWQRLEVDTAIGCAISPILFVAAFEIILIGIIGGNGWRDQITIWTEATPSEKLHGRCHQSLPNSSMYIQIAEKDG